MIPPTYIATTVTGVTGNLSLLGVSNGRYTVELQWLEHGWLIYHGCFELVLESLRKNFLAADLGQITVIFFFILKMVYCVFSLELPQRGNSNENTQHTFKL